MSAPTTSARPIRTPYRFRPGVHVVARDDDHVQVGLDPPARVVVRRDPDLLALLDDLRRGRPPSVTSPTTATTLAALEQAGLLVGGEPGGPADRDAGRAATGTVRLVDRGLGLGPLRPLLERAGISETADGQPPGLFVLGAPGPVPRSALDDWLCEGAPHLLLTGTGTAGSLRLGPLVEPGTTACLRCVDAAEATHDPRRTLVVEQLASLPTAPIEPAAVALGLAWAAREAATYLAGGRPLTWSGTIDLDGSAPVSRRWERHPHCGCTWDVLPY